MGVRQKLNGAIAMLAAMAVLSNVVAGLFFIRVQSTYGTVTEVNLPAVTTALNLSAVSAELAASAPTLAAAIDDAERERIAQALAARQQQLEQTLEQLKQGDADPEKLTAIEENVKFLNGRIAQVNRSTKARLEWTARRQDFSQALGKDFAAFQTLMGPAKDNALAQLSGGQTREGMVEAARGLIDTSAAVNEMIGVLNVAAQAGSYEELTTLAASYTRLNSAILQNIEAASKQLQIEEIRQTASKLAGYGSGSEGVFDLRRGELRTGMTVQAALKQSRDSAAELATKVDEVVSAANAATDAASASAASQVLIAQIVLVVITVSSLIGALLIGTVFVGRQISAPLIRLTGAMRQLADRDWSVDLPGMQRQDEIGDMTRAVAVFKSAGQDNERLQGEVEANRKAFEREREAQEQVLQQAVGQIVAAAAEGDLSRRIDTDALQGVMRDLGIGVNSLLGTVERALTDLGEMLGTLAQGDLGHRIEGDHRGLFARLAQDANSLAAKLTDIARRLSTSATAVRDASGEISSGSQDLAQRTESQAASIEETAASMHEITTTVKQNADNAQAASQLAMMARDTAEKGGSVVSEAVTAVTRIEESAQKISDIVGLIDEIAFQTNLLALNASVEAARAGEAGKGFAVVAQEVRALAQRSANASKDIKALISASNMQVKTGAGLVNQTGSSLDEIVTAVKKVADIVAEIAAASREQATGLDQVNTAVGQMDEMTQRNGALVEETSASAQALADQARELAEAITFFRLGEERPAAETAPEADEAGDEDEEENQPAA